MGDNLIMGGNLVMGGNLLMGSNLRMASNLTKAIIFLTTTKPCSLICFACTRRGQRKRRFTLTQFDVSCTQ